MAKKSNDIGVIKLNIKPSNMQYTAISCKVNKPTNKERLITFIKNIIKK